jgi:hypothetical protein
MRWPQVPYVLPAAAARPATSILPPRTSASVPPDRVLVCTFVLHRRMHPPRIIHPPDDAAQLLAAPLSLEGAMPGSAGPDGRSQATVDRSMSAEESGPAGATRSSCCGAAATTCAAESVSDAVLLPPSSLLQTFAVCGDSCLADICIVAFAAGGTAAAMSAPGASCVAAGCMSSAAATLQLADACGAFAGCMVWGLCWGRAAFSAAALLAVSGSCCCPTPLSAPALGAAWPSAMSAVCSRSGCPSLLGAGTCSPPSAGSAGSTGLAAAAAAAAVVPSGA